MLVKLSICLRLSHAPIPLLNNLGIGYKTVESDQDLLSTNGVTQKVPKSNDYTANWIFGAKILVDEGIEIESKNIAFNRRVPGILLNMFVCAKERCYVVWYTHTGLGVNCENEFDVTNPT
jgi:hypothetical protein